jgi:ATP adenylyltransferase
MNLYECKFCKIASSDAECLSVIDQPIYEDDLCYSISSIGGFISGWTLVFPKEHTFNLSKYYSDPKFIDSIEFIKNNVEKEYGQCVIFEHGAIEDGLTSCGVNHAHLHIVPFSESLEKLVKSDESLNWQTISIDNFLNISKDSEYLFCSDQFSKEPTIGQLAKLNSPQSQYFRKILAKFYGIEESYSYKTNKFEAQSLHTHKKLKKSFSSIITKTT